MGQGYLATLGTMGELPHHWWQWGQVFGIIVNSNWTYHNVFFFSIMSWSLCFMKVDVLVFIAHVLKVTGFPYWIDNHNNMWYKFLYFLNSFNWKYTVACMSIITTAYFLITFPWNIFYPFIFSPLYFAN